MLPVRSQHAGLIHVWIQFWGLGCRNDQKPRILEQSQIYEHQISGEKINVRVLHVRGSICGEVLFSLEKRIIRRLYSDEGLLAIFAVTRCCLRD